MSSRRSRRGGTTILTTSSRNSRSCRNRPARASSPSGRFVAATMRASTRLAWFSPTLLTSPSWIARSSFACARGDNSPTSSRNSVPPSAASNSPCRSDAAPVNAPRAWPNSSVSKRSSLSAAQLIAQNRRWRRNDPAWIALAISSFPVPLSPSTSTGNGAAAARATWRRSAAMASLVPVSSPAAAESRTVEPALAATAASAGATAAAAAARTPRTRPASRAVSAVQRAARTPTTRPP